jgi:hypothetical protein
MANDARLEQLRVAQEQAFTKKQEAYQAQQISWKRLSDAHDRMDRAYEAKQRAYESQERAWQNSQSVSNRNSPRIDYLNSAQEIAYQNMRNAFDRASSAHSSHEGASAKAYSEEGHRYQNEAKGYVEERRRLVEECKSARAQHEPYKRAFEEAKTVFGRAKDEYEQAKAAHERVNSEFKSTKTGFDEAAKAFQVRLSELKADFAKKKENNRALAVKAGVPYQYRDNVKISEESDGSINIFFGGYGKPDGPGHGHYCMHPDGSVSYDRNPGASHGAENFTNSRRDYFEIVTQGIYGKWDFGFNCQFRGYSAYVESNVNKEGRDKIDIYYGHNGPFGPGHNHAVAYREAPTEIVFDGIRE